MAALAIAAGAVSVTATLVASTVDTITAAGDRNKVRIVQTAGTPVPLYVTLDGSTPTVGGANTFVVPAVLGQVREFDVPTAGDTVVKVIGAGTPTYTVEAV